MKSVRVLIILFMALALVACSPGADTTQPEAPAENANQQTNTVNNNSTGGNNETRADVKDSDDVYQFISTTFPDKYNKSDFDMWVPKYFDLTGDGNDEVAYVSDGGKLKTLLIISADNGDFSILSNYIKLAKYTNAVHFKDGFIALQRKSGGTGISEKYQDFFIYNGADLVDLKVSLIIEAHYAGQNKNVEQKGIINGSYDNFTYTLNETDVNTGQTKLLKQESYSFNISKEEFSCQLIQDNTNNMATENTTNTNPPTSSTSVTQATASSNSNSTTTSPTTTTAPKPKANDYRDGYSATIEDDCVYVTYTNTKNKVKLYDPKTSTLKKSNGETVISGDIYDSEAYITYDEGSNNKLYFSIYGGGTEITLYVDMNDLSIYYVGRGSLKYRIEHSPYYDWVVLEALKYHVYDDNNNHKCELEYLDRELLVQIAYTIQQLEGGGTTETSSSDSPYTSETINGQFIDYSKYSTVIIPGYETVNKDALKEEFYSFAEENVHNHYFAIFGTMDDIMISYQESMDSNEYTQSVGSLSNSYVYIQVPPGTDFSVARVVGTIYESDGSEKVITLIFNDMSEEGQTIYMIPK